VATKIMKGHYRDEWVINGVGVLGKHFSLNDVIFPWESNPHKVRPWLLSVPISNALVFGCVAWGGTEQDAMDQMADDGFLDQFQVEEKEVENEDNVVRLGNASEPFDVQAALLEALDIRGFPMELVAKCAEGRSASGVHTLNDL
jgi:hypothetical protein